MDQIDKLFIQTDYANQLSIYLDKFRMKRSSPYHSTFRCDICGDSQKSKSKRRGHIIEKDNILFYKCFNCGAVLSFETYLKSYHPSIFQTYLMDIKVNKTFTPKNKIEPEKPAPHVTNPMIGLKKIKTSKKALDYILSRKIPDDKIDLIYYTENFYEYINTHIPDKFSDKALFFDHPRIVIPLLDIMGNIFGVQGRSLKEKDDIKYITILFNDDKKLFGIESIDWSKKGYCVEGPFDSFFLDNCIAMCGSDMSAIDKNFVIVLDNEPRKPEIVAKYDKYISSGYSICIWPKSIKENDINDMVLSGKSQSDIKNIINKNTYSGIKARIKLKNWKET